MIQVYKQSSVLPSKVYINTLFTARMSSPDEDSLHTPLPQEIIDLMEMSLRLSTEPDPQEHSVDPDSDSPLAHSPANSSPSPKEECTESADLVQDDGKPWWGEPSGSQLKRSPSPDPNSRLLLTSIPFMEVFHSGTQKIKHVTVTRRQVEQSLPWFQHLRAHLRASNNILNEYSETEFMQAKFNPLPASYVASGIAATDYDTKLALNQILFMHHHCSMHETLQKYTDYPHRCHFGLWYMQNNFRYERNCFSHSALTVPGGPAWISFYASLKDSHENLLQQVEYTTQVMEERLADEGAWSTDLERGKYCDTLWVETPEEPPQELTYEQWAAGHPEDAEEEDPEEELQGIYEQGAAEDGEYWEGQYPEGTEEQWAAEYPEGWEGENEVYPLEEEPLEEMEGECPQKPEEEPLGELEEEPLGEPQEESLGELDEESLGALKEESVGQPQ